MPHLPSDVVSDAVSMRAGASCVTHAEPFEGEPQRIRDGDHPGADQGRFSSRKRAVVDAYVHSSGHSH